MSHSPVKVGLVGCGNISNAYFATNARFGFFDITACADLDPSRAQAKAEEWDIARALSVEDLMADEEIGFVINLTVPQAHGPVLRRAVEAGKSVYTEKPFTVERAEAQGIIAIARERGLRVGSAPDTFLGGAHQTCRQLLDEGKIGEPVAATAFMMGHGHESWHPSPAFYYQRGGGPVFDMGPYYLTDLVNLLGPVSRVASLTRITFPERTITSQPLAGQRIAVEVPTHVAGTLEFENGTLCTLIQSFDVWDQPMPHLVIYGTEGTLMVPDPNGFGGEVKLRVGGQGEWQSVPVTRPYTENSRGIGMADMALAMQTGRDHRCNERVAYHVLDCMHLLHEAAQAGRTLEVESTCERPTLLPLSLAEGELDD